ncbi:SCAN domain-containing protein 3 [Elysia marginata]|uniref:SCAN domain-containing protein 3 n=1 Tax=Elysia marginata TaxID=1093978 RepID=A0AAV4ET45_9GAST|nr:SCAN domain-containing protein 3 [Elysia marginata]
MRFERFTSNSWLRDNWSSAWCALLTGRALDCYVPVVGTTQDYDKVKTAMMKRYDLTEDGYRRKCRSCKPAEEDLATILREKDLPTLERIAKEADLFLQARHRKLCEQPRMVFQNNARPKMDPVRLIKSEKIFNSGQRGRG